jgi:hypothetical protein
MLDGDGLKLCWYRQKWVRNWLLKRCPWLGGVFSACESLWYRFVEWLQRTDLECPRKEGDLFRRVFTVLSLCLVLLVVSKIGKTWILQGSDVRFYPKFVVPEEFKTRARDADLAIILDQTALEGIECQRIGAGQPPDHSVLLSFTAWLDCFPEEQKEHVSDLPKAQKLAGELTKSLAELKEGPKTEAAIFKEPHSTPAVDYRTMDFGDVIADGMSDRLDDALFLNSFGCWLFLVLVAGGLVRANAIGRAEEIGRNAVKGGLLLGFLIFAVQQWAHIVDRGPFHGWFATESFLPLVTATQWVDGLISLAICSIAGWLLVSFRPWCRLVLNPEETPANEAHWRAAADLVSAPIRVIRVLVLILIWMFAADFLKFFDQHVQVPEAFGTLWVHAAFLYLSISACVKFLPERTWSVSTTGIQIGDVLTKP